MEIHNQLRKGVNARNYQEYYMKLAVKETGRNVKYSTGPPRSGHNIIEGKRIPICFPNTILTTFGKEA